MGLKDDIKSKGFQSEYEKVFVNLIHTASFFESKFLQFVKVYDISPPQYNILRILRGQHPNFISFEDLHDRLIHTVSDFSRLIGELEEKGFVNLVKNHEDNRQLLVVVTPTGLDLLHDLDGRVFDFVQKTMNLPESQLMVLNILLDDLRKSVSQLE